MSADRLGRLTAAMKAGVDNGESSDAVVRIARRGMVVHLEALGYRDREQAVPMRPDAGSRVTRTVTGGAP